MILTTPFYDKILKILMKKAISKLSADSNILFASYARLCVLILLHRQLCSIINSWTLEFMRKLLLFQAEIISAQFLWGNVFLKGKLCEKFNFQGGSE